MTEMIAVVPLLQALWQQKKQPPRITVVLIRLEYSQKPKIPKKICNFPPKKIVLATKTKITMNNPRPAIFINRLVEVTAPFTSDLRCIGDAPITSKMLRKNCIILIGFVQLIDSFLAWI